MNTTLGSVMLVDDDADQRFTLQMLLSGYEMDVIEAGSGEEALEKLEAGAPNLMLLDFDMPGIDGLATLAKVREQYTPEELPVVMVSNRQDTDIIVNALDHGANDYVTKVTDPQILLARLRRHLIQGRLPNPSDRPFGGKIGPYLLGEKLGEDPMANLYRATGPKDGDQVVLKILRPGFRVNLELYKSWAPFRHPLLADLLDAGQEPVDYLVYQFVEGEPLDQFVAEKALPKSEVVRFALQIGEAIQAIHALGRRHGELRPSNIKIAPAGTQVLGFGFTDLLIRENDITRSDDVSGHPSYIAPEQLKDPTSVDQRADLYSFGGLLFTLATSRLPFEGSLTEVLQKVLNEKPPRPSDLRADGERAFDFVCSKLLSKGPAGRYSSCEEVCQKLRELAEEA